MLNEEGYRIYGELLRSELITAMGCTEPIAIAYAGALARKVLGREPDKLLLACSGNIVKNVKGVTVPNSGGRRGIEIAALLGVCWLQGGSYEQICGVITNTLATLGGMWCDGAKSSCASKIAAAVYTGLLSVRMSMNGHRFEQGEGIVTASVEKPLRMWATLPGKA